MASALKIFVDLQRRILVAAFNSTTPVAFPTLRQGETPVIQIFFLDSSNATPSQPYAFFDFTGATIKLGICAGKPTGGSDTLIAYNDVWTPIANGFQGDLSCNTAEITAALAGVSEKACTAEIEVTPSGEDPVKYFQGPMTMQAAVIDPGAPVPLPLPSYMSRLECLATFVKFIGLPGETITIVAPDGGSANILETLNGGAYNVDPINPYVP